MTELDRIKTVVKTTLEHFCQVAEEETESPLDELEIDILSEAVAQALIKDKQNENKS